MRAPRFPALAVLLPLAACAGVQSALDPAGGEAGRIHTLSIVLFVLCTVIFVAVAVLAALALFGSDEWRSRLASERLVFALGVVFPVLTLVGLVLYGVTIMGMAAEPAGAGRDALRIEVGGERWWWRVTYITEDGVRIESANELRIPAGQPVPIELTSADVIHSFWVPQLAGKLDMIPGRTNTLTLHVREPGISRGQCAEYCGGPHALMSFFVIAMTEDDFAAWLLKEASEARPPAGEAAVQGHALFLASGCGGCHAVRGTGAAGVIGPDLTHVGSRHSLAAASLPNDAPSFARWIRDGQHVKPENLMPPYGIFTDAELASLSDYLDHLD
jgi:cytochrome c oxidase subunit 2